MKIIFYNGVFLIHAEDFDQLKSEIQLDCKRASSQIASRVIIWLKGYDSPMYWSKSLDSLMGVTLA